MREQWKPIPGLEDRYEVSTMGQVRSIRKGITMSAQQEWDRRFRISLFNGERHRRWLVHQLVMLTFVGPCPEGHQVNHKDGDCANNKLDNLEYITSRKNYDHAVELLLHEHGEARHCAKLNDAKVREMRRLSKEDGVSPRKLAKLFDVSVTTTVLILKRKAWRHVE